MAVASENTKELRNVGPNELIGDSDLGNNV